MHGLPTVGACRFLLLHSGALAVGLAGAAALPCFCSDEAGIAFAAAPVLLFFAGLPLCMLALDLYITFKTSKVSGHAFCRRVLHASSLPGCCSAC